MFRNAALYIALAIMLSSCSSLPGKDEYPYIIKAPPGYYYLCKEINAEARIGYSCFDSWTELAEYHMGASDSWAVR